MSNPKIEANISEVSGPYYQVKLHAIPKVGELIDLFSFVDQTTNYPPKKYYRVVQVVHKIHDVSEKIPLSQDGSHFIIIYVTPETSEFFK